MLSRDVATALVRLLEFHHDNPPMQWDVHFLSDTRADFRLITSGTGTGEPMSLAIIAASWQDGVWLPLVLAPGMTVHQHAAPALVDLFCILSRQESGEAGIE